ncbi:hypothetical protein EI555_013025 [Monodon monoceros]|uniref:Protein BNIP5 n=1 Tax=Monodon monoceros TaxID=40151 RepID=A0A4U1EPJ5_MONMO|nr:hypothetical protein EI555_013025 [Monodon monoceros]
MEPPRGPRKPLSGRRARSLDRLQNPQKDSESWDCWCTSRPTSPSRRMLRRTASDGARCPKSPAQSAEAQGTTAAALSPEETREFLPSEQRPPQDTKKDKAQCRAQQGWLRTMMNFLFGTGPEEPKEKINKRAKGKEGLPEPAETPETPGEPAPRKKAHSKKASRKKHGHKKHGAEETKGIRDQEAKGQEPKMAGASCCEKADLGPAAGGGEVSDLRQFSLLEGGGAGVRKVSSQATGRQGEEELGKPDKDTIIQKIVEFLQKVGDQWEEEQRQASQPEVAPQNPAPGFRKKPQERKSSLKKAFSHKKHGSEEPKRARAADVSSPESRPPKRPSFLPLCVGGHRPSSSSSPGVEKPEVQEALSTDGGDLSPFELSNPAGSRGPEEDLQLDRASEFKFIQKIIDLLQVAEEQGGDKETWPQPPGRNHKRKGPVSEKPFLIRNMASRSPREGVLQVLPAQTPGRQRGPAFCPCVLVAIGPLSPATLTRRIWSSRSPRLQKGGQLDPQKHPPRPEATSQKQDLSHMEQMNLELIIQKLVALLQEVDGQLGEQAPSLAAWSWGREMLWGGGSLLATLMICLHFCFQFRQHPSFKIFYKLPDSSLRKLIATLRPQEAHSTEPKRPYSFVFGLANKCADSNYQAVLSLTGLHYRRPSFSQFPYREDQQVRKGNIA